MTQHSGPNTLPFVTRAERAPRWLPPRRLRQAYEALRADLHWVARDLRGEKRPFVVERRGPRRQTSGRTTTALRPRPLRVVEVRRETADAVTLEIAERDGAPLLFEAGQFLTFHLEVDGERLRRAYSLSSSPLSGPTATITVKRVAGGRVSNWLNDHARAGMELDALGPSGTFVVPGGATELSLIAGGSGITPILSIAETLGRARPDVPSKLIYGNRDLEGVIFRERLDALELSVEHVLEAPADGWTGRTGRLDADTLGAWLGDDHERHHYFVCGPEAMMDAAREVLLARGVTAARIHEERFRSPQDRPRSDARLPTADVTMKLAVAGRHRIAPVRPGDTILEAGLAAGAPMPFSCAMGGCAACKCRLVSGEVVHEEPDCLSPEEREDGWILACSSRPLGNVEIEVG